MDNTPLKRTPLFAHHVNAGARMVDFGGWEMPIQYTSILIEHRTVRLSVGLFDVCHMGEFVIEGPGAVTALQWLTTNDVSALAIGQVQYSILCYPHGGIVDDLTVYRLAEDRFMITVNASNIDKDWAWVTERTAEAGFNVQWTNVSEQTGLIAVQGPLAEALVGKLTPLDVSTIGYYHFGYCVIAGVPILISRTGYTGEDGFELYLPWHQTERVWQALLDAGYLYDTRAIGLGARDTLRLEMRYPLYGHDIDHTTNPLEAGLGWVVKPKKGNFIGRDAIEQMRTAGISRRLIGFKMVERTSARQSNNVLKDGAVIGMVTSGSFSPSLDCSIGLAYVAAAHSGIGTELGVDIRGRLQKAHVVKTPFWESHVKK